MLFGCCNQTAFFFQKNTAKKFSYKETIIYICNMKQIQIIWHREAREFLISLNEKVRDKIVYNARKATITIDKELFKKLDGDIWELRTIYGKQCYRFLAFWDKRNNQNTLVIVTHGFVKKTDKTPKDEIAKAENKRKLYFANN